MPQMADIVVKKADGTTDLTYVAQAPSSGDKTSAIWDPSTLGTARGFRPEFRVNASSNTGKTVRFVDGILYFPDVQTVGGSDVVANRNSFSFKLTVAENTPDATVEELVAQATNLLSSTLIRATLNSRFAPS